MDWVVRDSRNKDTKARENENTGVEFTVCAEKFVENKVEGVLGSNSGEPLMPGLRKTA